MGSFFPKKRTWKQIFEQGMAQGQAGDFAKAEASFRDAVRLASNEPYPHYELGYTLSLMGRCKEALDEFRRTEELCRGFFLVQTEIYLCEQFLTGQIDSEVFGLLRKLSRLTDLRTLHSDEGEEISNRVTELAPKCALGHYHFGKFMLGRDPVAAEAALRRCINLNPDETTLIDAKFHLGILRRDSGDLVEARNLWKSVLADYPRNPRRKFCELALRQIETERI